MTSVRRAVYHALTKRRADFVALLEALYAPEADPARWVGAFFDATHAALTAPLGLSFGVVAHEGDYACPTVVQYTASDRSLAGYSMESFRAEVANMAPDAVRMIYYPGQPVITQEELTDRLPAKQAEWFRGQRASQTVPDALGLFAYPEPGLAVVLSVSMEGVQAPAKVERYVLHRVAAHLDTALRLRNRPDLAVAAVMSPNGVLLDLEDPRVAARRDLVAARLVAVERSRLRERRREPDAVIDWHALIDGRYSIVPRDDTDGRRFYLLIANGATAQAHARFTAREAEVVRMAARGFTGKGMAYAMGVTPASISEMLGRAAAKVGLRSRTDLVAVAGAMFGPSDHAPREALTPAEQSVLDLLRRGLRNAEIARLRDRSRHTVAAQVSAILHKTGSPSRRALAARRSKPS